MAQQTLPQLLLRKAENEGNKIAFRQKDLGIWNEWTWKDYYEAVETFALGLQKQFAIEKSEKVGIIGDNRPHWIVSELAIQSLGAIPFGIYQDTTSSQLIHYIRSSKVKTLIVEDQEQVDKVLEVIDTIPNVEQIIYYNPKGLRNYTHNKLHFFDDIQAIGQKEVARHPQLIQDKISQSVPTDLAFIAFTSGTTGISKAAQFTHANLIQTALSIDEVDAVHEKDDYLSFLSLAWICEQVMAVGLSLTKGLTINFPEEPSTILNDLREIGPHIIQAPPRTYENILARFHVRISDTTPLKSKVYSIFEPLIEMNAGIKLSNRSVSSSFKAFYTVGDYLMFSAIRDHLGLSRVKRAYVTGGVLNSDALGFFQGMGVNVKQTYGSVESTGYISVQRDGEVDGETSGKPLPSTSVTLAENGELQVEGPQVFAGYLGEEKPEVVSTGDYGEIMENGDLKIIDRLEDFIRLETGTEVSSSQMEAEMKKSPYIQDAIVFGHQRSFLTAMVHINRSSVGRWAEKNQITYKSFYDLVTAEEVVQLIREEVGNIVKNLPEEIQVKRFVILPEELDVAEGELTPTQKVIRSRIAEKYEEYLNALYRAPGSIALNDTETGNLKENAVQIISLEISQGVA
ncbi:AMP-binding protein [Halobacillus yeomjeoni]|uniref:Acyl-CoA synthetase n=1 Tax=Halobacillus yeomjeoni TaxID=311194 RepID=A0A931MW99_9BACI|nr:AMP-binding protein [Halobacillus yeomjeoni]MBH0231151.1 AMP-binding protein [Halobacillus yeomjeoni]